MQQREMSLRSRNRLLRVELLDRRLLLASDLMNPVNNLDVNADNDVSAVDALMVVNQLNIQQAPLLAGEGESSPSTFYPDTNGDGAVSAVDALMVINELNAEGETTPMPTPAPVFRGFDFNAGYDSVLHFEGDYVQLQVTTNTPGTITLQAYDLAGNPIAGQAAQEVSIRGSLIVHASGSANQLVLRNATIPKSLIVHAKGHENVLDVENSTVGDDLLFFGANWNEHVRLGPGTSVYDVTKLKMAGGTDTIDINGAHLRRDVHINLGRDNDQLSFVDTTAERNVFVYAEHGDDEILHQNFNVGRSHHIHGHSGNDVIVANGVNVGYSLFLYGHEGEDLFDANSVQVGDDAHAFMGPGNDRLQLLNVAVADYAKIHGESGNDVLAVDIDTIAVGTLKNYGFEEATDQFLAIV